MTAVLLTLSMLISVSACGKTSEKNYSSQETFRKAYYEPAKPSKSFLNEDTYEQTELRSESGEVIKFLYDSDVISYIGQGGTFYLVGTDATKCFLHIVIQDVSAGSYEDAKTANSKYSPKDIALESGRKAFCFSVTGDEDNLHIMIDAKDIVPSGKGIISCYVGAKSAWEYSEANIANMIDKGFKAKK